MHATLRMRDFLSWALLYLILQTLRFISISLVEEKRYTVAGIPKGIRKIYSTNTKRAPTRLQRPSTVVSHPDKKLRGEGIIVT